MDYITYMAQEEPLITVITATLLVGLVTVAWWAVAEIARVNNELKEYKR